MSDEQVFQTIVSLASFKMALAWGLAFVLVVAAYAVEEAGLLVLRSERVQWWYGRCSWWLLALGAPVCMVGLLFVLFVNGMRL
jgi:hypothetical protein